MANYREDNIPFTHWTHIENGAAMPRRFHKIVKHYGDGPGIEMKGNSRPYAVVTYSGSGHKGQHVAHFYYKSDTAFVPNFHPNRNCTMHYHRYEPSWPNTRDIINITLGLLVLGIFRLIAIL